MDDWGGDGKDRRRFISELEAELLINDKIKENSKLIADECAERIKTYRLCCPAASLLKDDKSVEEFRGLKVSMETHLNEHTKYIIAKEKKNSRIWWFVGILISVFGLGLIKIMYQLSCLLK